MRGRDLTPVVVAARRTPIGTAGHGLREVDVATLAATTIQAVVSELPADLLGSHPVDEVVLGNVMGPGGNIARVAALQAGLPVTAPGITVDRQCGSGLAAITHAATMIRAGVAGLVLAGGAESASTAPWRLWPPTPAGADRAISAPAGERYERAPFTPSGWPDPDMGPAAEAVARVCSISRERQDAYAVRSHERAIAAQAAGRFDREIIEVEGFSRDERPRRLSLGTASRLPAAFVAGGTVTAANSAGVNDGAALVALVPAWIADEFGLPGLALDDHLTLGADPALPGLGPVEPVRTLLRRNGIAIRDVASIELTEAFAAQVLGCADAWGLELDGADAELVCPDGGAIALGHPWGASGAVLVVRLFSRHVPSPMVAGAAGGERSAGEDERPVLATCAIGGGQGIALLAHPRRPA